MKASTETKEYKIFIDMGYGQFFEPVIKEEATNPTTAAQFAFRRYFGQGLFDACDVMPVRDTMTAGRYAIDFFSYKGKGDARTYDMCFPVYVEEV